VNSKTEYLTFNTTRAFVNITQDVRRIVEESKIKEGLCLVNVMRITASIFINDNESDLHEDFDIWLEKIAPHAPIKQYRHNETGEDNADAHLKRQVMGREVIIAITNGKLDFGPWEQIFMGNLMGDVIKEY
jgi:secondary thiamine-phosphate synthase enzyme